MITNIWSVGRSLCGGPHLAVGIRVELFELRDRGL